MSLPVFLTAEAEADLDEAALWYEGRSAGLGSDLVARVRATLDKISDTPALYPELHAGLRRAAVKRFPYGVFYRVRADRVEVVGVFHDRRDPSAWQSRA
jgi:plasmid stabilization system protein ParE